MIDYKKLKKRLNEHGMTALVDNKEISKTKCVYCESHRKPHSAACPRGERYKQVQIIGGVPVVPE